MVPSRGHAWSIRYEQWTAVEGVMWPTRVRFDDREIPLRMDCRVQRVRFSRYLERGRLAVSLPPDADRMSLVRLRRALERVGEP
jgi:hypothetical protein